MLHNVLVDIEQLSNCLLPQDLNLCKNLTCHTCKLPVRILDLRLIIINKQMIQSKIQSSDRAKKVTDLSFSELIDGDSYQNVKLPPQIFFSNAHCQPRVFYRGWQ